MPDWQLEQLGWFDSEVNVSVGQYVRLLRMYRFDILSTWLYLPAKVSALQLDSDWDAADNLPSHRRTPQTTKGDTSWPAHEILPQLSNAHDLAGVVVPRG